MRRVLLSVSLLLAGGVLAGCGGGGGGPSTAPSSSPASISPPAAGGAQPPEAAPGLSGLERTIAAAHATVTQSQQDAQRASATSAGQ